MRKLTRRDFLQHTSLAAALPSIVKSPLALPESCWLEVLVPFIVQDQSRSYSSQFVLPSGTFAGREGYRSGSDFTDYEILGYDQQGKELSTGRFKLPPMNTRAVDLVELYGGKSLVGGARIRMRPHVARMTHYADLFSAAFVRWNMGAGFSYVHAYPDPPHLRQGRYISILTMPQRPGASFLSVFNPNPSTTHALVEVYDDQGQNRARVETPLTPYGTKIFDLRRQQFIPEVAQLWEDGSVEAADPYGAAVVSSRPGEPRVFFFFLCGDGRARFSNEHPVLQGGFTTRAQSSPAFSADGQFQAEALVYSPFFFHRYQTRGLTLRSRAYLGAGRPVEDPQWLHPFLSGDDGNIYWSSQHDQEFSSRAGDRSEKGVLRLHPHQVQRLDSRKLPLPEGFAGGLGIACRPVTNHTLMKIEIEVAEWDAVTFSHFRPGSSSSRKLLEIATREGVTSDYMISGVHVEHEGESWKRDALLSMMNIEFAGDTVGSAILEAFGPAGFVARRSLDGLPPLACRFFWVSDLFPQLRNQAGPFSLRLMDTRAVTIVGAIHFDFSRRQLAVDHGSDRFSTYLDYSC